MGSSVRLILAAIVIVGSAAYAVLVNKDPGLAAAIASGYVAIVVTLIAAVHLWRKP